MIVYTAQRRSTLDTIVSTGVYTADVERVEQEDEDFAEVFATAYNYMSGKLSDVCPPPGGVKYPIWSYSFPEGCPHDLPDVFCWLADNNTDDDMVVYKLDIPDDSFVVSNFDNYHCILNQSPCITTALFKKHFPDVEHPELWESYSDAQWDELYDHYSSNEDLLMENWDNTVFDLEGELFTQVCFWEIRAEHIVSVTPAKHIADRVNLDDD